MSKVIVFGSHGKVGQRLVKLLAGSKYNTTGVVRNETQAKVIEAIGKVHTSKFDLALATVPEITSEIKGQDAIVLSVGSGGKDLLKVDLDSVVKTFEAAVAAGIRRLILVSAIFADDREFGAASPIRDYFIAKHYADRILINEFSKTLDYTILKPSLLTDGEETGKIKLLKKGDATGLVERADVAKVIFEILENKSTFGKSYDFSGGNTDIGSVQW